MLRSMTGFGRCLVENTRTIQQWEVKSVNSRHLDLKWRLPLPVRSLEPRLEKVVRRFASRGRVDISLTLQYAPGEVPVARFDAGQANAMLDSLHDLALARGDDFMPDYSALMQISSLWNDTSEEMDEDVTTSLEEGLALALEDWNEARAAEGRALATDMHSRILRMEEWTGLIAERAPAIKEERANIMRERLGEALAQNGQELEEGRFLQEIVVLADRLDVSEELTRLSTHLERLHDLLQAGRDAGRRLDFTLQECFREINTCGNKLPDVQLSRLVVDFKNELEKCREQVQNLE
ncbi:YicC/YloC family endoribonuclease [Desulfovibrio falkowii]|uniref:YicC family protein n=2 Tax=Desulfovibrio TaxID=872 RepID=B8J0M9_DESDA|nr:YicC/YloC family endoribonuclease [uncultured Desulfovibrio sp.]